MNIDDFRPTSLSKFLDFCEQVNKDYHQNLRITEADWENMCGITIESMGFKVCFNFWNDGSFRCLIDCKE